MRLSFELFINRRTSVAAAFDFGDRWGPADLFLLLRIGKMHIAIKPLPRAPPMNTPEGGSLMSRTMDAGSTLPVTSAQVLKSQVRVGWVGRSSEVSVPPATPPLTQCA